VDEVKRGGATVLGVPRTGLEARSAARHGASSRGAVGEAKDEEIDVIM
jgi:hypothetical protein